MKNFKLKLWQRILLYIAMIVFATLALVQVATERFPFAVGIAFFALAGLTIFPGMFFLVLDIIAIVKKAKTEMPKLLENPYASQVVTNRYFIKLRKDSRLRAVIFSVPGTMSNVIFALFNGFIGIYSHSSWFGCLSAYYILLSIMRILVVDQERQLASIEEPKRRWGRECDVYRRSSILLTIMAFVLVAMVSILELSLGGKEYPGLTIYGAAMFAFYKIIKSTINVIKARKKNSPMLAAIRRIGHVDACVSILTLQTAMFASFGGGQEHLAKIMNGATGLAVCLIVLFIGIDGIREAIKMKKLIGGK